MRYILLVIFVLGCAPTLLLADEKAKRESTVKSFGDYVKIRYMPSRSAFLKKEPITELKSAADTIIVKRDGRVMGTNNSIKQIYSRAKLLKDKGIIAISACFT